MGINSINTFLKKKAGAAFTTLLLKDFKDKRIAIDMNNYLYTIFCVCSKNFIMKMSDPLGEIDRNEILSKVIDIILNFILNFLKAGVTPVFVWDGEVSDLKSECRKSRKQKKTNILDEINMLKEKLLKINPVLRKKDDVFSLKKKMCQYNYVSRVEMNAINSLLQKMGIPSIKAPFEGEKLCASLAIEGVVAAVWSADTDNYALGTPILITGSPGYDLEGDMIVDVVILNRILGILNVSHKLFVDLCIMCGCDFNTNIKGIGVVRSFNLLTEYKRIPRIMNNLDHFDFSVLNYKECREIFKYCPSNLKDLNINKEVLYCFLEEQDNKIKYTYNRVLLKFKFKAKNSKVLKFKKLKIIKIEN